MHDYCKREHNHEEIGYKNRAAMSFPNLRPHRFLWTFINALQIGTKPLYYLFRPLITYPNLLSLLQKIIHSCIIFSLVSLQGALQPIHSFPTQGLRAYPRRGLANRLHTHASNMKNKTQAHSRRHFLRVD